MQNLTIRDLLISLALLGISATLAFYFYNSSMYGPDDGYYAYIAEEINNGKLHGRDIVGFHPGYVHHLNAAIFKIFDSSFLSLRFPLILSSLIQTLLVFLMFRKRDVLLGVLGGLAVGCMSFILFPNPATNWYCGLFLIGAIYLINNFNINSYKTVFAIGLLIGFSFLFRHLSGIFIASGVMITLLSLLIYEAERNDYSTQKNDLIFSRIIILLLAAPLAAYLAYFTRSPNAFTIFSISIWPLAYATFLLTKSTAAPWQSVSKTILFALLGCFVAALPLLIHQGLNGNIIGWAQSLLQQSVSIPNTDIENPPQYFWLLRYPITFFQQDPNIHSFINLVLFAILPCLALLCGLFLVFNTGMNKRPDPFLIIGCFYAYAALYLEIPSYLFYTLIFSVLGCLSFIWSLNNNTYKIAAAAVTLFLCASLPYYHAGQSVKRTFAQFVTGKTTRDNFVMSEHPKIKLNIDQETEEFYKTILQVINDNSDADDTIFAYPFNPELYYLSGRENVINAPSTLHVNTDEEFQRLLGIIQNEKPALIIHSYKDKYNSEFTKIFAKSNERDYKRVFEHDYQLANIVIYKKQNNEENNR